MDQARLASSFQDLRKRGRFKYSLPIIIHILLSSLLPHFRSLFFILLSC